ncbi:MAG: hypothetical protein ACREAA_08880 [Candidatus Polarisedimenticolia bacterium]
MEALTRAGQPGVPGQGTAEREAVPVPGTPAEPPPTQPSDVTGAPRSGSNIFNPNISAVFQLIGATSLGQETDEEGFSLTEGEVALQAVVDPYARMDMFLSFTAEGEAAIEEGTVTTTSLPAGLQLKGGRFKSDLGKWNRLHPHQFFTVDRPDVLVANFGDESLTSDGLSMSWLVPGTASVFLESTTEVGNPVNDISFNSEGNDPILLEHLASVFTLTSNATLGVGGTAIFGNTGPTEGLLQAIEEADLVGIVVPRDNLDEQMYGVDMTFKWKPLQRNVHRSALLQAEAIFSRREVDVLEGTELVEATSDTWGGYAYGEYQFARRWRGGIRWDWTEFPGVEGAIQRAVSGVLRIIPTEFQEFRVQYTFTGHNTDAAALFDDQDDEHQIFFEWIPAIGAHGAHPY